MEQNKKIEYTLRLADNALILGHRLSEWCSKAPTLEIDMALSNIALDLIGQSRNLYQYAASLEGKKTEDDFAYLRDAHDFKNCLLVEMPNGDFAMTIMRQFLFSAFQLPFYEKMKENKDEILRGVSEKAVKEVSYHLRWSSEWVIRLGDGTEESHARIQKALNSLWAYCGEMWTQDALDIWATETGFGVDLTDMKTIWYDTVSGVLEEANLTIPESNFFHKGGKTGKHTEHLGYLLAEMQFLQRAYPNSVW
jgi:ring-1,2-phenylacetyl-CoA epoxidase subunit PaaC